MCKWIPVQIVPCSFNYNTTVAKIILIRNLINLPKIAIKYIKTNHSLTTLFIKRHQCYAFPIK